MKITLDLSRLVQDGRLTPAEAERLKSLAAHETGALGINILVGFGVVAVSAGALAFLLSLFDKSSIPVMAVGAVLFAIGLWLTLARAQQWELLAQICIVTGALMWGVQLRPDIATWLGGLPFLAPFHSLVAWLFAAFIIIHVYMTTTGATPVETMRAMITGWEDVEVHESA